MASSWLDADNEADIHRFCSQNLPMSQISMDYAWMSNHQQAEICIFKNSHPNASNYMHSHSIHCRCRKRQRQGSNLQKGESRITNHRKKHRNAIFSMQSDAHLHQIWLLCAVEYINTSVLNLICNRFVLAFCRQSSKQLNISLIRLFVSNIKR